MNFRFLWPTEHAKGIDLGKARPCLVLGAVARGDGQYDVAVAPLTHTPQADNIGIEVPGAFMKDAGLDGIRQYVVANELNRFTWPSPLLEPLPRVGGIIGGRLPDGFCTEVRNAFQAERQKKNTRVVDHGRLNAEVVRRYRQKQRM